MHMSQSTRGGSTMRYLGGLVLFLAASCTKPNPAASCANGQGIDPAFPFCDVDGGIGGEPNVCLAVSCTPGAFAECRGDTALTCNSDGTNYDSTACQTGCSAANSGC